MTTRKKPPQDLKTRSETMNRSRPKQIVIRATEEEKEKIQEKVKQSNLKQNDFLLKSALGKEIVVIDGLREITLELKKIGNNLNQVTKAVHEGRANCSVEIKSLNGEMVKVWQLLRQLTQKQV